MGIILKQSSDSRAKGSYILSIAKPCGESWANMSKSEQGNFCSNCQKHVLDFSGLSDTALVEWISKTNGSICGRLSPDQMNRIIATNPSTSFTTPFYKKIAAGFLMLGLFENQASASSGDKNLKQVVYPVQSKTETKLNEEDLTGGKDSLQYVIEGVVRDSKTKEPVAFAVVAIPSLKRGSETDKDGHFKFTVMQEFVKDTVRLEIRTLEYEYFDRILSAKELAKQHTYKIELVQKHMLGLMTISGKVSFWYKVKHPFTWRRREIER